MAISIQLDEDKKIVTITMPIEEQLRPSGSGKTLIVATTRGLKTANSSISDAPFSQRPTCSCTAPTSPEQGR
jgi:hypothetical protein